MEEDVQEHVEEEVQKPEPADSVWLLMGKEYRISRSIRLQWFFQHLNSVVTAKSDEEIVNSNEELEILSILPVDEEKYTGAPLCIGPKTKLPFVGRQYRFVFCIDMTPSLATVDTETGEVLIDVMFENLKNSMTGLVQPFHIPGCSLIMRPRLHVTVLAHTYIDVNKECRVLVQGFCVNELNVKSFLCQLKRKLQHLEKSIAEDITNSNAKMAENNNKSCINRNETSLFFMVRDGLVALQLLPDNASAGIIVVTDGVFILENALITDALLAQVRASFAVCSFLQVGSGYRRASVDFGYVPHCALMQFIATATSGAYLATCPPPCEGNDGGMNVYQKSLYCLNFQRDIDRDKIDDCTQDGTEDESSLCNWADYFDCLAPYKGMSINSPPQPRQTMRYKEFNIKTRISSVLTVRSREGYIADGIQLTKDNTHIEVKLVWPWKEHITIEYIAKAAWPFDCTSYLTHVVINISGPYEFLVDIISRKPKNHKPFRKTVLQRFEQTMKGLEDSDQLLVQLQLFPIHSAASKIPDTIAKGSPLFHMPANSNNPIIALQYGSKSKKSSKSADIQFASFWKSVVTMDATTWRDTRTWAKWWHCHRITILPEHDRPVTKDLFIPSSTNHYPLVHCRNAIHALLKLMQEWCSFILLNSHSYVKFLSSPGEEKPHSFCLLRLTFRGLCIGVRWAFLAGTPGEERLKVYKELKLQLMELCASIYKISSLEDASLEQSSKPMRTEDKCLIILTKPVERILVKYDSIPDEVKSSGFSVADSSILNVTLPVAETPINPAMQDSQRLPGSVLSQYLFNQRWVWGMRSGENAALDSTSIAHMLDAILQQRLNEGFHFSICSKGIISLVKEVDVMVASSEENMANCCVIQYVLFPPHQQSISQSNLQDDSAESDVMQEAEEDMQMVVEVWVEPQYGTMHVVNSPLDYINGVEYYEVPSKMFAVDAQIVTEISSYMLIHATCVKKDITNCFPTAETVRPSIPNNIYQSSSLIRVPFLYDIVSLLRKSRLILSVYPMMKEVSQGHLPGTPRNMNDILLSYINSTLVSMHDSQISLRPDDRKMIYEYIKERCMSNNKLWRLEENELIFNQNAEEDDIHFSCYIKSFGMRLIIMLLPASMRDLDILVARVEDDPSDRRNLPLFIFECDYQHIQNIPSIFPCHEQDILQDYTEALTESALTPRHLHQKLPNDRSRNIAVYCQAVYEHYFWAFVSGVYKCLQSGYKLDPDDVELSIDLVCEESIREIDLTNFLMTTCSHYNEMVVSDNVFSNDETESFTTNHGHQKTSQLLQKTNSGESNSSSKHTQRNGTSVCENIPLQAEIQREFMELLDRYFHYVPGNDFYMYFVEKDGSTSSSSNGHGQFLRSRNTTESNHDDDDSTSTFEGELDSDTDSLHQPSVCEDVERPMFLHLTCSCHYKSVVGNTIKPISIKSIPTCLRDIINQLDECVDTDPCNPSLSITLTLICLTQPSEPEQDEEWTAPKDIILTRQNSDDSSQLQGSVAMSSSKCSFNDDSDSFISLPKKQKEAMTKIISDIKWLLEDEIASALRLHVPLTEKSLDDVASHVDQSTKLKNNCICEIRYFMFVTGTEKATDLCLPLFVSEVEDTLLGKYKLIRVGKYWCAVVHPLQQTDTETDYSVVFKNVKEAAKVARKGMRHRRSRSDFRDNRPPTHERTEEKDFNVMTNRTISLPLVNVPISFANTDVEGENLVHANANTTFEPFSYGSLWQADSNKREGVPTNTEGDTVGEPNDTIGEFTYTGEGILINKGGIVTNTTEESTYTGDVATNTKVPITISQPITIAEGNSSKSSSSLSLNGNDMQEYLQRSLSFTEEKTPRCETIRKSFSLSDICVPGSSVEGITGLNFHRPLKKVESLDNDVLFDSDDTVKERELSYVSSDCEEEQMLQPHPDFWLFMKLTEESVYVYLHRRRSEPRKNIKHQKGVYQRLLESLDKICKIVNQRILLDQLYTTNNCHSLLIAEDDDQIWKRHDKGSDIMVIKKQESNTPFSSVMHGEYKFQPGYFECEIVAEERIPIHNRLSASNRVGESSKALLAVRNELNKFRVANRQNLFVIKDGIKNGGNIFYFRVNEGSNDNDYPRVNMSPPPDDDHLFTPVREDLVHESRASSISSLVNKNDDGNLDNNFDRYNYDRQESYQSGQYISKISDDKCSISETSSHIHNPQDYLHFCIYGIRVPSKEIKEEIVKIMKKKLDLATLDIINQSLARNYKCRLTPQDVEFIQPPGESPSRILTLCVSNAASKYLHAMILYLHQYLLEKYYNPRYTGPDSECHFKNYCAPNSTEYISMNDVYLYNRREMFTSGIAIAYLTLVDQYGNKYIAQPSYPSLNCTPLSTEDHFDILNQLVVLKKKESLCLDDANMCQNIFIRFNIWMCGDIDLGAFEKDLIENTRYALYDVFLEYHLLCTPISFVSPDLQSSSESRRESTQRCSWGHIRPGVNSSGSSAATTPKLLKSHPPLKKFSSEPTTPSELRMESPVSGMKYNRSKDDLSLVSESPRSYPKDICNTEDAEKKRHSFQESRHSPLVVKDCTRGSSPLARHASSSSRNSGSIPDHDTSRKNSRIDSPLVDPNSQLKTITMSELNQLKDSKDATYVMLTDAEVHESLKAVTDDHDGQLSSARMPEVEPQRKLELDKRRKRRMLEHGKTGELHSNYHECSTEIFNHMIEQGNQSLHKQEGFLTHQYMLESIMKEFKTEMMDKCRDIIPKEFKERKRLVDDVETTIYVQYHEKSCLKTEDSTDSSASHPSGKYPSIIPGQVNRFIVIGHNAHKWSLSMGTSDAELSDDEEGKYIQEDQSKQKFKPLISPNALSTQERRKLNDLQPPSCISYTFVPRQKFFMAVFDQKKITLYTYNYSNDVTTALDKQLKRLYAWQNVRTHLNACLFIQKLGLYHHKHFVRDCPGKEDADVATFASTSSRNNLLPLMKEVSPTDKEKTNKQEQTRNKKITEFDDVFRDTSPTKVLHNCSYFHIRDTVKRQAYQYQDVRNIKLHRASKEGRLKEIFDAWKDKGAHVPITEEQLLLLKKHSRLSHYCGAPILFNIEDDTEGEEEDQILIAKKNKESKNSPHSLEESDCSFSMGTGDWYQELLLKYIQYLQTRGLNLVQMGNRGSRNPILNKAKSFGVKISRTSNRSSDGKDIILAEEHSSKYYLQQTSMAGILLMEVTCEKDYLCYNMFAFESVSLREVSSLVSAKDQRSFFEDCGKFKDLTYIRSFAYDYHIRQINLHLCGRHSIFPKGYPVHTLMQNILNYYPTPPRYCTCMLTNGIISLPNSHAMLQSTIYNYLVINANRYDLTKIVVSKTPHDDIDYLDPSEYILTCSHSTKKDLVQTGDAWRSTREAIEYDGNIALQFKPPENNDVVEWPFFLLLANKKEFYPRPTFMPTRRRQKFDSEQSICDGESAPQKTRQNTRPCNSTGSLRQFQASISQMQELSPKDISLSPDNTRTMSRSSESEYLFSLANIYPYPLTAHEDYLVSELKFVELEVSNVRSELNHQVSKCLSNCLRDLVWNALLISETVLEDDSLSKKMKKKTSLQSFDETSLITYINEWKMENKMDAIPNISISGLTFDSIKLLLGIVTCYHINEIDSRISEAYAFILPGLQQNVIKTLNAKYGPFCRQFLSEDGETTYLCVINPRNLDMLLLVEADEKGKRMGFSAVYRSLPSCSPLEETTDELLRPRERHARDHIENVITCLCYDIWLQLLPT